MPIGINYKRLLEVHILQEYFLKAKDEEDVFGMGQDELETLLAEKIKRQKYNVHNEFLIEPNASSKERMQRQNIEMLLTPLGFFLGLRVEDQAGEDGLMRYSPSIPLPVDTDLVFSLSPQRLSNMRSFTQQRLDRRLPAIYYFSNLSENDLLFPAGKLAPALSLTPLAEDALDRTDFLMGELALRNDKLQEAIVNLPTRDTDWQDIDGQGLVNERDRRLLPTVFEYQFFSTDKINQFKHVLKDAAGVTISESYQSQTKAFIRLQIDLRPKNEAGEILSLTPGHYVLELTAWESNTERWQSKREVVVNDDLYDPRAWGVLHFQPSSGNASFDLLRPDDLLVTEKVNGKTTVSHPTFELRLRSRLSWWRYQKPSGFSEKEINKTDKYLEVVSSEGTSDILTLVSKQPHRLSVLWRQISFPRVIGLGFAKVPLPGPENLVPEPEKMYADVYVSEVQPLIK
ncbi:MAG: hypothetical protein AAF927_21915 [Bacteroidota bacterium]